MRKIFVLVFSLAFTVMYCQTRPNNFTEVTSPNNDNFEVYSQKNGLPRRASLNNLKKFCDQAMYISNDTIYLTGVDSTYTSKIHISSINNGINLGDSNIDSIYIFGSVNLQDYGSGNKEAADLSKTGSGYFLEIATDGTLIESSVSSAISYVFEKIGSTNSADTVTVLSKPSVVSLTTENSRSQFNVNVSSLADVRTLSFVIDLTVGTRQTETIIKVDDASNQSNMDMTTLMFPEITVYDLAPTLLDVKQAYNVTQTLTNGDLPHNITWNNDGTYNIVFGQGDWGSKSKVLVTIKF